MPKRVSLLQRRADLTSTEYSQYWSTTHAAIAKDFPRLQRYVQNHVRDAGESDIDGIVELWFADDDAAMATFGSAIGDRLKADEVNFLGGLTGRAYYGSGPHDLWPSKVWGFASLRDGADLDEALAELERTLSNVPDTLGSRVDAQNGSAPLLLRELLVELTLPEVVFSVGFSTADAADAYAAEVTALALAGLTIDRVIRADEVVVV